MPQSLSVVFVHLIFSTKDRRPYLRHIALRESAHAYLAEISRRLECPPLRVGGVEDHVHILARLGRGIPQAEWVKELKRVSSLRIRGRGCGCADFRWQGGYAAFSVSQSNLGRVARYITDQVEHHRRVSYQDELRAFLRRHNATWDERYVWD